MKPVMQSPAFEHNAVIAEVIARFGVARFNYYDQVEENRQLAAWFNQRIRAVNSLPEALDYWEAITSQEVYELRNLQLGQVLDDVLALVIRLGERDRVTPAQLASQLRWRGYWGQDGHTYGRPLYHAYLNHNVRRWHASHMSPLQSRLNKQAGLVYTTLELLAQYRAYQRGTPQQQISYVQAVCLESAIAFRGNDQPRLFELVCPQIGNETELLYAVEELAKYYDRALAPTERIDLVASSFTQFYSAVTHCAEVLKIANAVSIKKFLDNEYRRTQAPLQIGVVISLAHGLMRRDPHNRVWPGDQVDLEVPAAMGVVGSAITHLGQNSLTDIERQLILGNFKFIGDVFVLGRYTERRSQTMTVGEFLERYPLLSEAPSKTEQSQVKKLKRQFGSVVHFRRWQPGYGYLT